MVYIPFWICIFVGAAIDARERRFPNELAGVCAVLQFVDPGAGVARTCDQAFVGIGHHQEDLPRADALYAQAMRAMQALYPDGNPDMAVLLNNRALLNEDRGDYPAALALHRQSLAMRRKVFSREHPMTLTALANVARVSLQVGEAKQALPLAEGAAKLADRVYADAPNGRHASTFVTLAETRLANGDAAGAAAAISTFSSTAAM